MLRDSGLGERKLFHDIATNTGCPAGEETHYLDASGMAQRFSQGRQLFVGFGAFDGPEVRLGRFWFGTTRFFHRRFTIGLIEESVNDMDHLFPAQFE
jgi:hypothetical protein